jgi:AmmeMemoRadiSam system protein B/AmmeMemoRadiSam system protein A
MGITNKMKKYNLLLLPVILIISCNAKPASPEVRKSVLAGSWYSSDSGELASTIDTLLRKTETKKSLENPLILILPHAGYQYSGMVAAAGYNLIKNTNPGIIVLMAPSHHSYFHGCSTLCVDYYETPLGRVRVEKQIAKKLLEGKYFKTDNYAHRHEHAIEIHLPFLQRMFKNIIKERIGILPILVGDIDNDDAIKIAKAVIDVIGNRERPLIIVSTDFTHYGMRFNYVPFSSRSKDVLIKKLRDLDYGAIEAILKRDARGFSSYVNKTGITICGRNAIRIALSIPIEGFNSELIMYRTSGDVSGDYDNSVSYAAIALSGRIEYSKRNPGNELTLSDGDKRFLLSLARRNIQSIMLKKPLNIDESTVPPSCRIRRGAFVTLKIKDNLRGCIGYFEGVKPLYQAIIDNSFNAAFKDPRFLPLKKDEFSAVKIEISVLTEPRELDSINEIEIGRDGLIIDGGYSRGLLLPQVPVEWGWNREEFLIHTCRKARLPDYAWRGKNIKIYRFQATIFSEDDLR